MADSDVQKQLKELLKELDELRKTFDLYFEGLERVPPTDKRDRYKSTLRKLREDGTIKATALKFQVNQLWAKLMTYDRLWNRTLQEIEDGTFKRDRFKLSLKKRNAKGGKEAGKKDGDVLELDDVDFSVEDDELMLEDDDSPAFPQIPLPAAPAPAPVPKPAPVVPAAVPVAAKAVAPVAVKASAPVAPTAPRGPVMPGAPRTVSNPGMPAVPAKPGSTTTAPTMPGAPRQPSMPGMAAVAPRTPSSPTGPTMPGAPRQPSTPGMPATAPRQPSSPGMAAAPPGVRPATAPAPVARPSVPPAAARPAPARPGSGDISDDQVRVLAQTLAAAKKQVGDRSETSMETLKAQLSKQIPAIKQQHGATSVEFKVVIKDNQAVLKAIPKK